jgi:hypothetical protein
MVAGPDPEIPYHCRRDQKRDGGEPCTEFLDADIEIEHEFGRGRIPMPADRHDQEVQGQPQSERTGQNHAGCGQPERDRVFKRLDLCRRNQAAKRFRVSAEQEMGFPGFIKVPERFMDDPRVKAHAGKRHQRCKDRVGRGRHRAAGWDGVIEGGWGPHGRIIGERRMVCECLAGVLTPTIEKRGALAVAGGPAGEGDYEKMVLKYISRTAGTLISVVTWAFGSPGLATVIPRVCVPCVSISMCIGAVA